MNRFAWEEGQIEQTTTPYLPQVRPETKTDTQPTEAQKHAGNYPKEHIKLHGLDISIENKKGTMRSGTGADGKQWSRKLVHDYGYIRRTEGYDGDQVDVFIGPSQVSERVFVVEQHDPATGEFDEHKVLLGFRDAAAARAGYLANYERGWKGLHKLRELPLEEFKVWLKGTPRLDAHVSKPGSRGGHIIGYRNGEPVYGKGIRQVGIKRSAEAADPYGNPTKVEFWKNPTKEQITQSKEYARGFVLPSGDFILAPHMGTSHPQLLRGARASGDVSSNQFESVRQYNTTLQWGADRGISVQRVGTSNVFAIGERHLLSELTEDQQWQLKNLLIESRRINPHVKFVLKSIDDFVQDALRTDDEYDVISALFGNIRVGLLEQESPLTAAARFAAQMAAAAVNGENQAAIKPVLLRLLRVDPFASEPWLLPETRNWVTENVSLIRSIGQQYLGDVEKLIYRMVREGKPIKEVRQELAARFGSTRSRARLIARDQVNKYNGQLTQARQVNLSIKEYTWKTVEDQRVRGAPGGKYPGAKPSHYVMEGVRCRWDDPTVYHNGKAWVKRTGLMPKAHPGSEIQCRCMALPQLPDWMVA